MKTIDNGLERNIFRSMKEGMDGRHDKKLQRF